MTTVVADPYWRLRGNCLNVEPDVMSPSLRNAAAIAKAKDVCGGCPVKSDCLAWATQNEERFGVWGGLSPQERGMAPKEIKGAMTTKVCAYCQASFTTIRMNQTRCSTCSKARHGPRMSASRQILARADEIATLRCSGMSYARIGQRLGFPLTSIRVACVQLGVMPGGAPLAREHYALVS